MSDMTSNSSVRHSALRGLTTVVKQRMFVPQDAYRAGSIAVLAVARLAWFWKRRHGDFSLRVVEALVAPGDRVVDIGASWGLYTARLITQAGRSGQVDIFEPHPKNMGNLRALAGRRANVTLHAMALSDHAGEARLYIPIYGRRSISALGSLDAPRNHSSIAHEQISVPVNRLDDILAQTMPVKFMKIDVEGHELAVLQGAKSLLRRDSPSLLIEIEQRHPAADIAATFGVLTELGYAGYAVHSDGLRPIAEFDVQRDQLAFLDKDFVPYGTERGYVYDFLFTPQDTDVSALMASH